MRGHREVFPFVGVITNKSTNEKKNYIHQEIPPLLVLSPTNPKKIPKKIIVIMNRLKNYKRLEFVKEGDETAKAELESVLERYDEILQEKTTEAILQVYRNSIMELERRKLAERAGMPLPRIDRYVHTLLDYSFTKLHKGNKLKAYEIIEGIKEEILETKLIS